MQLVEFIQIDYQFVNSIDQSTQDSILKYAVPPISPEVTIPQGRYFCLYRISYVSTPIFLIEWSSSQSQLNTPLHNFKTLFNQVEKTLKTLNPPHMPQSLRIPSYLRKV